MAKLYTGFLEFNSNFTVTKSAPLDDRIVVQSVSDLTSITNTYKGLAVTVVDESTLYVLTGDDSSLSSSWQKVSAEFSSEQSEALNAVSLLLPQNDEDTNSALIPMTDTEGNVTGYQINAAALTNTDALVPEGGALDVDENGKLVLNTEQTLMDLTGIEKTETEVDGETVTGYSSSGGLTLSTESGKVQLAVSPGDGIEISSDNTVSVALGTSAVNEGDKAAVELGFTDGKLTVTNNLVYQELGELE